MKRLLPLAGLFALVCMTFPVAAGEDVQGEPLCYWCIRDAIYADISLIDHLEANPDIDDSVKGPQIAAARADIHRLRKLLGPIQDTGAQPCCYARKPLVIR
jgi:hypothetical protein